MEIYQCYQERGFAIDLKDSVYYWCYLQDTDSQKQPVTPCLMSIENYIDLGIVLSHLLGLMQVEEMVIVRVYIQILIKHVCRHQYHYTGYCVIFMQNIVRTVDMLPTLLSELDIILLQLPVSYTDDL